MPVFCPIVTISKELPAGRRHQPHTRISLLCVRLVTGWLAVAWLVMAETPSHLAGAEPAGAAIESPLSPQDSLRHFVLADDNLAIEIAAAEPEVIDPVAIRFDERGRMWVIEMRDYPTGPKQGGPPQSQIRVLSDEDHDGHYEKSRIFADNLIFPTGLQPWKGGVFVTLAGRIAYFQDTDGDGHADVEETLFTGFAEQNTQLRANHPRLGIDGWIYVANGLKGGKIKCELEPDQPEIVINGMDFRFHPLTFQCEAVTGNGQFGMTFDGLGNRFVCSNRNPLEHVVLENWQIAQTPQVPVAKVLHSVAAAGEQSQIFPLSRAWTTSNLHAGQFTAACGCSIYHGDALGAKYAMSTQPMRAAAFICDPTANLVHCETMKRAGGTFAAQPEFKDKDFLASPDEWFRPVNLETGPDGALYVVDMYRAVIEHPDWVPAELKHRPDERFGSDRGRVYRIAAKGQQRTRADFGSENDELSQRAEKLVDCLQSANGWTRDTAARMLWENDKLRVAALPKLRDCIAEKPLDPFVAQARELLRPIDVSFAGELFNPSEFTQDVWTVWKCDRNHPDEHLLKRVGEELVREAFTDGSKKQCPDRFYAAAAETTFQSLLLFNTSTLEERIPQLFSIAENHGRDPWFRQALLMAAADFPNELLLQAVTSERKLPAEFLSELALQAGQRGSDEIARKTLQALSTKLGESDRPAALECALQLAAGLARRKQTIEAVLQHSPETATTIFASAKAIATAKDASTTERVAAIRLLAFTSVHVATLQQLWQSRPATELQLALVSAMDQQLDVAQWGSLLDEVSRQTPAVRQAILQSTLRQPQRVTQLLDRFESQLLRVSELDPVMAQRLLATKDAALLARAQKLLAAAIPADRATALAEYQPALQLTGNPNHGKLVFQKNCATCHRIGSDGVNVAPDISDTRTKSPAQLMTDILQPNRAIDANFVAYTVALDDGTVQTGILAAETSTSITLRQPGDKTLVLTRDEIEELRSAGVSLMPEGLERNIPLASMADLLAYLKNWRYLDGKTPRGEANTP